MKREIGFKCLLCLMLPMDTHTTRKKPLDRNKRGIRAFFLVAVPLCVLSNKTPLQGTSLTHSLAHLVYPLSLSLSLA